MRTRVLALALLAIAGLALAATGCGGDDGSESSAAETVPFDRAFIDAMVPHHEEAIASAKEAKEAGLNQPDLVEIADAIIATQQAEIDQMLAWRADWFGSGELDPTGFEGMGMSMEEMGMQHDPGDLSVAADVDGTFAAMMVDHHNGAIAMATLALERAEHPEIRELAEAIIAAQQAEVEVLMGHASGMQHG